MSYHEPVLLKESVDGLAIKSNGKYVDVTFGGGGHSREILNRLSALQLISFDQDEDASGNTIDDARFVLVHHSFIYLKRFLKYYNMLPVDGLLADLGISSWQIDTHERGFSTRSEDALLDMRMDKQSGLTAKIIIGTYSQEKLQLIFQKYGEIQNARKLASTIVVNRQNTAINTVRDLKYAIKSCVFKEKENRYHAQVFQALRIEVNQEQDALKKLLVQSAEVLSPGGRLVVISYHSLEDRLVKSFMAKGKFEGEIEKDEFGRPVKELFRLITRKPITPSEEELKKNPRARSAKLRIAEKI